MPKICFIGAGSTTFAKNLLGDILTFPELAESVISLHDIDEQRLAETKKVADRIAQLLNVHPTVVTTRDRRAALEGADYAIAMFAVGGYQPATVTDFEIPKKYGLRQTIGDTLGIGGIMRGLRTIPVLLDMCRDMEEVCPDVTFLNYVNPMAINCLAVSRASTIKTVGLCHSVQNTAEKLARDIHVPIEEINFLCAGINHVAFYLRFERRRKGGVQDLYPLIRRVVREGRVPPDDRVRYEMLDRLGYFVTESSEHFAEYVPWFIRRDRPDLIERFNIPLDEYLRRCEVQIESWNFMQVRLENPEAPAPESFREMVEQAEVTPGMAEHLLSSFEDMDKVTRSNEYGPQIIHSLETGTVRTIYGNVPNRGLIDNLPAGCVVEVPCLVDRNGVQPTRIGVLPPQLAALMQANVNVQGLTVEAALSRKREHIYHAAMLDPHTAAELELDQIWQMVDELIRAHGDLLPVYH
jgi:alpha-galactosidase